MTKMAAIDPSKYSNSEVHQAVLTKDYSLLNALLSGLPRFSLPPSHVHTESASNAEIEIGRARSSFIDFRNPDTGKETPLHLAVRLADPTAVFLLMEAGADFDLQNDSGWNALEEAVHLGKDDVARIILHHARYHQWANLRRRLPLLLGKLGSVTDFYAELSFRFESSVLPFVLKIAPSDTVRVWKRGKNIRVDTSLTSGFGMFRSRRRRSDRTLLLLGESVWALYHRDRTARKIFDGAHRDPPSEREVRKEVAEMMKQHLSRPGLDTTNAKLKGKTETSVGPWKSTAYKIDNILLSMKHRRVLGATAEYGSDMWNEEELNEMLTAEEMEQWNAAIRTADDDSPPVSVREESVEETESGYSNSDQGKQSGKKKVFKNLKKNLNNRIKKIAPLGSSPYVMSRKFSKRSASGEEDDQGTKDDDHETMYDINFKCKIWLSDEFPLQIQHLLPLLDILGHKSKLIRGLKEILTSLPHEAFPVKASFPIMNVIKLIVSCTKFEELKPTVELPEISSNSSPPSVEPYGLLMSQSNRNIDDPFMIPLDYKKIA